MLSLFPGTGTVNLMISPFHSWLLQGLQCKTYTLWSLTTFPIIKSFRACFKTVIPEFLNIFQSLITNCWYTLTKLTLVAIKTTGAYASEICPCVDTRSTIQARSRRTDVYFLYCEEEIKMINRCTLFLVAIFASLMNFIMGCNLKYKD